MISLATRGYLQRVRDVFVGPPPKIVVVKNVVPQIVGTSSKPVPQAKEP